MTLRIKVGAAFQFRHDYGYPSTPDGGTGAYQIAIHSLLQLAQALSFELDGLAGEPMDVLVNGCLIAQGEVVVVNENLVFVLPISLPRKSVFAGYINNAPGCFFAALIFAACLQLPLPRRASNFRHRYRLGA